MNVSAKSILNQGFISQLNGKISQGKKPAVKKETTGQPDFSNFQGTAKARAHQLYNKNIADAKKNDKADKNEKKTDGFAVEKNDPTLDGLSDKAKSYLSSLKEKFGNVEFQIGKIDEDKKAVGKEGKEFVCTITPELLEKMAADETTATKYESLIEEAGGKLTDAIKELKEKSGIDNIDTYGINASSKGVDYYVLLKDSLPAPKNAYATAPAADNKGGFYKVKASSVEQLQEILEKLASGEKTFDDYKDNIVKIPPVTETPPQSAAVAPEAAQPQLDVVA